MYSSNHFVVKSILSEFLFHVIIPAESQAKINKFDIEIFLIQKHDIFQFKIAMADVLSV